jgi:hypothetical protein
MDAMSHRIKQRRAGGLTLMLYQRTLHPELFKIYAAEKASRRIYDADIWLVDGGHVISFQAGKHQLTEIVVVGNDYAFTDRGLLQTVPCRGEKYHETVVDKAVRYMISTQEEQLSGTLYEATRNEISSYARSRELMTADVPATAELGGSLHVLDIECRSHELLVQSFHLFDESNLVIKTQGIIEVMKK